jgi:hypothetical protein
MKVRSDYFARLIGPKYYVLHIQSFTTHLFISRVVAFRPAIRVNFNKFALFHSCHTGNMCVLPILSGIQAPLISHTQSLEKINKYGQHYLVVLSCILSTSLIQRQLNNLAKELSKEGHIKV